MILQDLKDFLTSNSINSVTKEFSKGIIFNDEIEDEKIFFIVEGTILASILYKDREILSPYFYKKNNFLGLIFLFEDYHLIPHIQLFSPDDNLKVLEIDAEQLRAALAKDPAFHVLLLEEHLKVFRDIYTVSLISTCGGTKAAFAYLLYINSIEQKVFFFKYTDFANMLNISSTMLYKLSNKLEEEGIIVKNLKYVEILDTKKLMECFENIL